MQETQKLTYRALKKRVLRLLKSADLDRSIEELLLLPARHVINPLFSFLYHSDPQVKWRAVTAFGAVVANLSDKDMESGRIIMRRIMWNLNDESGGIGWGAPEAMGETLARHEGLAKEYADILLSYAREDGNYLEHEMLQRGLLWGVGRLAEVRPHLIRHYSPHLVLFLKSGDATVRGLAVWVMGLLGVKKAHSELELLARDEAEIELYSGHNLLRKQVKELVQESLAKVSESGSVSSK